MRKVIYLVVLLCCVQCREKYEVFIDVPDRGLLVVEGYVNGDGITQVRLSRTTQLSDRTIKPELRAVLFIEGKDGTQNFLYEVREGEYTNDSIQLNPSIEYRLKIFTEDRSEYETDYRSIIQTPVIDSVSHNYHDGIVDFYSHSRNADDRSIFYKWDYVETWEFRSTFFASLQYKITGEGNNKKYEVEWYDSATRKHNDSIYRCWKEEQSTGIILGSAAQQGNKPIMLPVRTLKRDAFQLTFLYSILVKQYGLREESYEFYRRMKKNSESLGTIFDAQPSELVGNLTCVTDPSQQVIGFVEFGKVSEKRYFVYGPFIPGNPYDPDCPFWEEIDPLFPPYPYENKPEVVIQVYKHRGLVPTVPRELDANGNVVRFYAERPRCVDCTMRGSNVKPAFWP